MSRHQIDFILPVPPAAAFAACRAGVSAIGWSLQAQHAHGIVCVEPGGLLSFTSPVTAEISVGAAGRSSDQSAVVLRGSNLGLGPIQSPHVRKQVNKLREAIEAAAARPASAYPDASVGSAASSSRGTAGSGASGSRAVVINGRRLSDEQVATIERTYGVRLRDGSYWYDRMMGAWGCIGGPTAGFILPGLDLGGPLAADASNGNTRVFINGRQLPLQDVLALQRIVPMVLPGRYWMDAQGNVGYEGGPFLGNIWAAAAASGAPREGILSTYDKTGAAVIG